MRQNSIFIFLVSWILSTAVFSQDSLYQVALKNLITGNHDDAYETFENCAHAYRKAGNSERYALCHIKMSECLLRSMQFNSAVDHLTEIETFIEEELLGNAYLMAENKRLQGEAALNLGKPDEALTLLLEAENTYPLNAELEKAEMYNLLGVVYGNNQNKSLALQYHQQALKLRKSHLEGENIKIADSYNNIGLLYISEDPTQAGIFLNEALAIYEAQLGTLSPKVAFVLLNLAQNSSNQFRFLEAERYIDQVQQIWKNIYGSVDHPNIAFTTSIAGQIKAQKGELDQSLMMQQAALQQYIRLFGPKHPDVANQHQIIGKVYSAMEEFEEAIHAFQSAIYANLENQNFISIYETPVIKNFFHADYLLSALMDKAASLEALHLSKTLKQRDLITAINTFEAAKSLISEIRKYRVNESDKLLLGSTSRQLYESAIRLCLILGEQPFQDKKYFPTLYNFIENSKASVLQQAIQDTKAKSFSGIPDDVLSLEDSIQAQLSYHQQKLASGDEIEYHKQEIFSYQTAYRNLIAKLEQNYPNYYQLKYSEGGRSLSELQDLLSDHEAVIQYFLGERQVFICYVSKSAIEISSYSDPAALIKNAKAFKNGLKYKLIRETEVISQNLRKLLIPSIEKEITKLYIIPDGVLNTFPFEALQETKTDSYLIQEYDISYAFAGSMLKNNLEKANNKKETAGLFAPVDFSYRSETLPTLSGSENEILELGILFKTFGIITDNYRKGSAKEEALKGTMIQEYSYLHLATHGKVNQSSPELSRLYLKADDNEDGILYSGELYNIKLNARLVTLSACETGLGKITAGEGIVGLSRALLYAGADNLVVSLWTVSDTATANLMKDFYKSYLSSSDRSLASAMRKAKIDMIQSEQYSAPYYWSPFVLIGQ
ncbi:MAG: CHAT domain-containing protein [Cyclobacteriaceae bacterium]